MCYFKYNKIKGYISELYETLNSRFKVYIEAFDPDDINLCTHIIKELHMVIPSDVNSSEYIKYALSLSELLIIRITDIKSTENKDCITSLTDKELLECITYETFYTSRSDLIDIYINAHTLLYDEFFIPANISTSNIIAYGTSFNYILYTIDELNRSFKPFINPQDMRCIFNLKSITGVHQIVSVEISDKLLILVNKMLNSSRYASIYDKLQTLKSNLGTAYDIYYIADSYNISIINKYNSICNTHQNHIIDFLSTIHNIQLADSQYNTILDQISILFENLSLEAKDFIENILMVKNVYDSYIRLKHIHFKDIWNELKTKNVYDIRNNIDILISTGYYYLLLLVDFNSGLKPWKYKHLVQD